MKETKERLPFHMVITNNETGDVVHDMDLCVLIGAAQTENDATACLGLAARCDILDIAAVIFGVQKAQTELMSDRPELLPLLMGLAAADDNDEDEE